MRQAYAAPSDWQREVDGFLGQEMALRQTAETLIETGRAADHGIRVIPSPKYVYGTWLRDATWTALGVADPDLTARLVRWFSEDQRNLPDGRVATALIYNADGSRPINRDRDDESTLLFIVLAFQHVLMGGSIDPAVISRAWQFVRGHVVDGRYLTRGEVRTGTFFNGDEELGMYHYWIDTFQSQQFEVIAYTQGLYAFAARCLKWLGLQIPAAEMTLAREQYAGLVNPADGSSIPQREGASVVDVSALTGEALSLHWFDDSLLGAERVASTFALLRDRAEVRYSDGSFLGFKILSEWDGSFLSVDRFAGSSENWPGNYHNGASWLLYDSLALFAAARHGLEGALSRYAARQLSEFRTVLGSHEYLRTSPNALGEPDVARAGYAWNAFAGRLTLVLLDLAAAGRIS